MLKKTIHIATEKSQHNIKCLADFFTYKATIRSTNKTKAQLTQGQQKESSKQDCTTISVNLKTIKLTAQNY